MKTEKFQEDPVFDPHQPEGLLSKQQHDAIFSNIQESATYRSFVKLVPFSEGQKFFSQAKVGGGVGLDYSILQLCNHKRLLDQTRRIGGQ